MREIKDVLKATEDIAYKNVEGFDFTKVCFKLIFDMLNDDGVFKMLFEELLPVKVKSQIKLKTFKYIVVKGEDAKIYPAVDWIITLKDCSIMEDFDFCLTLTPFTASFSDMFKDLDVFGEFDDKLTQIWCVVMKGLFKEKWEAAFERYCANVEKLRDGKIETGVKLEQACKADINSIQEDMYDIW